MVKARYVSESRGAQLVVDRERHNALIVEGAPASEEKAGLKFQTLGNLGELIRTDIIDFEVKGGLESWAVTSGRGETLVALITGDSMIGQSILHIGSINLRQEVPTWGWRKELPLPDIHVSEPVWIETTGVSPVLTIMKWVDAEATLGLYRVAANTVKQYPDQGIHRKGSIVSTGFEDAHDIRLTAILRHREGDIWKFELCKIKI